MNVDAATTTQIKVTFSKEMLDRSWSWSQMSKDSFPQIIGKPKYLEDKKTCVIDVKLEPKKTYVIWVNTQKFGTSRTRTEARLSVSSGFPDQVGKRRWSTNFSWRREDHAREVTLGVRIGP